MKDTDQIAAEAEAKIKGGQSLANRKHNLAIIQSSIEKALDGAIAATHLSYQRGRQDERESRAAHASEQGAELIKKQIWKWQNGEIQWETLERCIDRAFHSPTPATASEPHWRLPNTQEEYASKRERKPDSATESNGKLYGYNCPVCGEPIDDSQPMEHTDEGLAHAACCKPDSTSTGKLWREVIAPEYPLDKPVYGASHLGDAYRLGTSETWVRPYTAAATPSGGGQEWTPVGKFGINVGADTFTPQCYDTGSRDVILNAHNATLSDKNDTKRK